MAMFWLSKKQQNSKAEKDDVQTRAAKAGEETVHKAEKKARRIRTDIEEDEALRTRILLGIAGAVLAAGAGVGSWFLWKKRDERKAKKALQGGATGPSTAVTGPPAGPKV